MKKLASIMFLFMLLLTSVTGCSAALPETDTNPLIIVMQIANPVMTVNGTEKEIDPGRGTSPIIQNDRTFLPVRAVVEAMGGSVAWDGETQTVVMAMENDVLLLSIGNQTAYFNETAQTLDAAPVIVGERTMFPIRFIAECFGFEVEWEESTVLLDTKMVEVMENGAKIVKPVEEMKNKSSRRTLPIPQQLYEYLLELKEKQAMYREMFKSSYNRKNDDFVCVDELGELIKPSYVTARFAEILKRLGMRKIRFHDLRHTVASILLAQDVPLINVSDFLGHSDIQTTANIYAHLDKKANRKAQISSQMY